MFLDVNADREMNVDVDAHTHTNVKAGNGLIFTFVKKKISTYTHTQ